MTMIFISPTEPKPLRDIGTVTPYSEEFGCDVFWHTHAGQRFGIQRKEFPGDFLASVHDGRLAEQIAKGSELDVMILMLEGRPVWTTDGKLIRENGGKRWPWTKAQHRNFLATVQYRGVQIQWTDGLYDTIDAVKSLAEWSEKDDHTSLDRKLSVATDKFGRKRESAAAFIQRSVLQQVPGIGPRQARAIIERYGFPVTLTISERELNEVAGIGKKRAGAIGKVFGYVGQAEEEGA